MWHKISVLAVLIGAAILILGAEQVDFGVCFRQICTGLLVLCLGVAALYAESKEAEDAED